MDNSEPKETKRVNNNNNNNNKGEEKGLTEYSVGLEASCNK
jgi:hypothetical protein